MSQPDGSQITGKGDGHKLRQIVFERVYIYIVLMLTQLSSAAVFENRNFTFPVSDKS